MKSKAQTHNPVKICIVEDDSDLRESISGFIAETKDYECVGAFPSGEEALQRIANLAPNLVIMDINLPGMNGIKCVRQLKAIKPEVQVLMLTVYDSNNDIFEALAAGANGYLLKSTTPEKLLEALKDMQTGGSAMSPHIARKVVQAFQNTQNTGNLTEHLATREDEVLRLLAKGYAYKQIADELNLSIGTIRTYIWRIYKKLHVNCRTEAVAKYLVPCWKNQFIRKV